MQVQARRRYLWWFRAWWSKNPLLRPPTRAERLSTVGAALLCLVLTLSVPVAAVITWDTASARVTPSSATHTVQATVTAHKDSADLAQAHMRIPPQQTVQWRWQGELHTDQLPGTTVPAQGHALAVQVDEHGKLLSTQYGTANAVTLTVLAATLTAVIGLCLAFAALRARSRWLLQRRAQTWEREWQQVQPRWTGRGYKT